MIYYSEVNIINLIVHSVGNKLKGDNLILSDYLIPLNSELEELLLKFFITPFKSNEFYNFNEIENNVIYHSTKAIFNDNNLMKEESKRIARCLFDEMRTPKAIGGNLFVAYFKNCIVGEEMIDAIGIFKTDTIDNFIKIKHSNDRFIIENDTGINIAKLSKGCFIYNCEQNDGYLISVIDKKSKNDEISYWKDNFLNIIPRKDEYFYTKNTINCIESFISNALPDEFDINRSDQVDLLNKTIEYFSLNDDFEWQNFSNNTFPVDDVKQKFDDFKKKYEKQNNIDIADKFSINSNAVKTQTRNLKSTIKLDDTFDITIHKDKQNLIRGKDESTGLNYYQLLFNIEE